MLRPHPRSGVVPEPGRDWRPAQHSAGVAPADPDSSTSAGAFPLLPQFQAPSPASPAAAHIDDRMPGRSRVSPEGTARIRCVGLHAHARESWTQLAQAPLWSLSAHGRPARAARTGSSPRRQIDGLRLRLLAQADRLDVAAETAATSTAVWVGGRDEGGAPGSPPRPQDGTGDRGGADPDLRRPVRGAIDLEQARVVVRAIADRRPVGTTSTEAAGRRICRRGGEPRRAGAHGAGAPPRGGARPRACRRRLGRRLDAEERAAVRASFLSMGTTMTDRPQGVSGCPLPTAADAPQGPGGVRQPAYAQARRWQLGTGLPRASQPRSLSSSHNSVVGPTRPPTRRTAGVLGGALGELIERLPRSACRRGGDGRHRRGAARLRAAVRARHRHARHR